MQHALVLLEHIIACALAARALHKMRFIFDANVHLSIYGLCLKPDEWDNATKLTTELKSFLSFWKTVTALAEVGMCVSFEIVVFYYRNCISYKLFGFYFAISLNRMHLLRHVHFDSSFHMVKAHGLLFVCTISLNKIDE